MTKMNVFLFFTLFSNLFLLHSPIAGQLPVVSNRNDFPLQWTFQGKEYTRVASGNLCPFTVEVYPEILYVGDPLHVRINFQNNTDENTYVDIFPLVVDVFDVEFYFRHDREILNWSVGNLGGGSKLPIWQIVKPGEKAPAKYMSLGFPGAKYGNMQTFGLYGTHPGAQYATERWGEMRTSAGILGTMGMRNKEMAGQLLVVINRPSLLASLSPRIVIKQRSREEMDILEKIIFSGNYQGHDLEPIIPKLIPGTLKNLLRYQLLLLELKDGVCEEPRMTGAQVFEKLEEIENFLKPLHEIERESLRPNLTDKIFKYQFEREMQDYSDKHLEKFLEVFGKGFTHIDMPHAGTPSQRRGENRPIRNFLLRSRQ